MAFEVFSICSLPWTLSCSSPGASVGVRAILARFVVALALLYELHDHHKPCQDRAG